MHYSSQPVPNTRVHNATITNVAQDLIAAVPGATGGLVVQNMIISSTGTSGAIIFRSADGTVEYFRIGFAANVTVPIPFSMMIAASLGLEVIATAALANPGAVTLLYWTPGAAGIGV